MATKTDDNLIEETPEVSEDKPKKKSSSRKTASRKNSAKKNSAKKEASEKKTDKRTSSRKTSEKKTARKTASRKSSTKKTSPKESEETLQLELDLDAETAVSAEPEPEESKPEPVESEPEKPMPEPAVPAPEPEESGSRVIKAEDYQPIIWVDESMTEELSSEAAPDDTAPEVTVSQPETTGPEITGPEPETSEAEQETQDHIQEKPEYDIDEVLNGRPAPPPETFPLIFRVFGAAFAAILIFVFVLNIIVKDRTYSDHENRVFQQLPSFSPSNYLSGRFESQLDNYANDQFAGRNMFIKIKSAADLSIGQLKANGVFKAKDNYLIEDVIYPDKSSEEADIEALKKFKNKYGGKKLYFMLVPNAANILKEKLPGGVTTRDQNKDMDNFFKKAEKLGYKTIDVRDELAKAKDKMQIYYRTDHHWTTDGAYVAYKKAAEIMKLKSNIKYKPYVVKKDFVGTLYSKSGYTNGKNDPIKIYLPDDKEALRSVIRYKDTKEKTTKYYVMENLDKKDAYTVFGGTNQSLFSISTPTKRNRNLLIIKDSYANCFIPFLMQDYRTITVVDPRYYYENIATVIKANDIDEVLFLYNSNTYFSDNYMRMMLTNK